MHFSGGADCTGNVDTAGAEDIDGVRRPASHMSTGKMNEYARVLILVCPDPMQPAMLADVPEADAHQGAAHSPCVLFGSYGCHPHFQSRRCSSAGCVLSAARFSTRTSWTHPAASHEKQMGGRYGLASRVRPSRLPQPTGPPIAARERTVPATEASQPPSVCSNALPRAWVAALQPQTGSQTLIDPSPSLPPAASCLHATGRPRSTWNRPELAENAASAGAVCSPMIP